MKIIKEIKDIDGSKYPALIINVPDDELFRCKTIKQHEELVEKYLMQHIKEYTDYRIEDYE